MDDVLSTALDLSLGLASFAVRTTGEVEVVVCDAVPFEGGKDRIAALARSSLEHPDAQGRDMFWNAEVATAAGSADRPLACVVVPAWAGSVRIGLLGVVDTWLPEPDDDQRAGLEHLARTLARALTPAPAPAAWPDSSPFSAPAPAGGAGVHPGVVGGQSPWQAHEPGAAGGDWPPGAPLAGSGAEPRARASVQIDATQLAAALDDGVVCVDAQGIVVLSNRAADAFYGLSERSSLVGAQLPALRGDRAEDGEPLGLGDDPVLRAARAGEPCALTVATGEHSANPRWVTVSARPFALGARRGVLVVLHDSTAEWLERERLTRFALYDPLTGLANRYLLLEEIGRMLQGLGRNGGSVALVYMDLDRFKHINDEHGHDVGDEVLGAVARRLRGAVRSDDVVARLGGDEFVIAHTTLEPLPDGDVVVSRLRDVLSAPFRVRGHVFDVGASIGWVSTDRGDVRPESLLARADHAMYRHKRQRAPERLQG